MAVAGAKLQIFIRSVQYGVTASGKLNTTITTCSTMQDTIRQDGVSSRNPPDSSGLSVMLFAHLELFLLLRLSPQVLPSVHVSKS